MERFQGGIVLCIISDLTERAFYETPFLVCIPTQERGNEEDVRSPLRKRPDIMRIGGLRIRPTISRHYDSITSRLQYFTNHRQLFHPVFIFRIEVSDIQLQFPLTVFILYPNIDILGMIGFSVAQSHIECYLTGAPGPTHIA